ncbi:MAG: aminoacyl-tRNA hydrolase [Anaerolineae bacterium]|nr:aminoacyl-tRNA hydrolase [Anaerolineae bacterium]MDW8100597.1 aminoacyl-tRNA hydrolase [Anaerolineae bacterium]
MKMVVGLGNPGPNYERHRHNIGFQCVDLLARTHGLSFDRRYHQASLALGQIRSHCVILVKPMTFMNAVGPAVAAVARFHQVAPEDMLVIYDDLDLPLGKIRLRPKGSSGGHNGVKSLIQHLGTQAFPRLRIGIGRPIGSMDPADYVLQDFSPEQEEIMVQARERAVRAIERWLEVGIVEAMNEFNSNGSPPR